MSAFSVENPHDGKTFENYTRFEWSVEVGVITTFVLRLFVPHEFDMGIKEKLSCPTPQSNRPLAWFLRPIKFRHKLLFKLLI